MEPTLLKDSSVHLSQMYSMAPAPRPQKAKEDQKPLPEAFGEDHDQSLHLRTLPLVPLSFTPEDKLPLHSGYASHSLVSDLNGALSLLYSPELPQRWG